MARFTKQCLNYYLNESEVILTCWHLRLPFVIVLHTLHACQLLSLCIYKQSSDAFMTNVVIRILGSSRQSYYLNESIYPLIGSSEEVELSFILVFLGIDCIFIAILLFQISTTNIETTTGVLPQIKISRENIADKDQKYLSLYIQIYQEGLQVPLLYCQIKFIYGTIRKYIKYEEKNMQTLDYVLILIVCFSMLVTMVIHFFLTEHSNEYRFKNFRLLGTYSSKRVTQIALLNLILIVISACQINETAVLVIGGAFLLINVFYQITGSIYISTFIQTYTLNLQILELTLLMIFLLIQVEVNSILLLIMIYPFLLHILQSIQWSLFIDTDQTQTIKFARLIFYIFKQVIEAKTNRQTANAHYSLLIYSFVTNHLFNCSQKRKSLNTKCFCEEYDIQHLNDITQLKAISKGMIQQTLEDEAKGDNREVQVTFICFLIQIRKLPTQALYEVLKLQQRNLSNRDKAALKHVMRDALDKFQVLVRRHDLKNQKYYFQELYEQEQSLQVIKSNMMTLAKWMRDWYSLIVQPTIDVDELQAQGMKIIISQKQVQSDLEATFKMNPDSEECDTIFNLFHKYFAFNEQRKKEFRRDGGIYTSFAQMMEKQVFEKNNSFIQITLLQPRGNVIRYTKGFQQAVGWEDHEIMNQNIRRFIPRIIANDHDLYLSNFVEKGRINIVKKEKRVILALNKQGFVFPINTRLRIEATMNEFGASALITPVNLQSGYLMVSQDAKIQEISQELFEKVFTKYLGVTVDVLRGMDALLFLPQLSDNWNDHFNDHFENIDIKLDTQLIIPILVQDSHHTINTKQTYKLRRSLERQLVLAITNHGTEMIAINTIIRITSLVTINLKLVIIEFQEYNLEKTGKIPTLLLEQQKRRGQSYNQFQTVVSSSKSINTNNDQSIQLDEYDDQLILEDEQMILAQKQMFEKVQLTEQPMRIQTISEFIENMQCPSHRDDDESHKNISEIQQKVELIVEGSIGSQQLANKQRTKKVMLRNVIYNKHPFEIKWIIFLAVFFLSVSAAYALNYSIIHTNLDRFDQAQTQEVEPHELAYLYQSQAADITYRSIAVEVFQNEAQYVTHILKDLQYFLELSPPFEEQMITIINQLLSIYTFEQYVQITSYFNTLLNKMLQNSPKIELSYLQISIAVECIFILVFMFCYIALCVQIIKRKIQVYMLFTNMERHLINDMLVTFQGLTTQTTTSRFKIHDTDEEQFESMVLRFFKKQSLLPSKSLKVGKSLSESHHTGLQLPFLLLLMASFICLTFYIVISYAIFTVQQSNIKSVYNNRNSFYNDSIVICNMNAIRSQLSQTNVSSDIFQSMMTASIQQVGLVRQHLQQYNSLDQIYDILTNNMCDVFSITRFDYVSDLFNQTDCKQLDYGNLIVALQNSYTYNQGYSQSDPESHSHNLQEQWESFTLMSIAAALTEQLSSQISKDIADQIIIIVLSMFISLIASGMLVYGLRRVVQQLQNTKLLISLLPLDRLLDNAYVISFIQQ